VEDFARRVTDLVDQFGHLSNSGNDFSARPWRESPEMVLGMVMEVEPPREQPGQKVHMADLEKQRKAGLLLKLIHRRAREFRLLRERVSGLYTLGYGLFRYYYLALGRHFVRQGLLEAPEDIYYLTNAQVHAIVNGEKSSADLSDQVNRHKADMQRFKDIQLPTMIYGDEQPQIQEESTQALVGVSTSLGCYTGKVCVVHGLEDFPKMKPGEVLVIPFSEISWTPLFANAGAVVAESGGLLSHSSIVAREYNIPAVVSVEGATRLPDGTLVTVDAYKGEVFIHGQGDGTGGPDPGG
jgi:pyruvate,water dikinase